jgi:cytidylate kinase
VYLTASVEERARRRAQELDDLDYDQVAQDLVRRDRSDSTRAASPLVTPDGAVEYDTTGIGVDQVVDDLVALVERRS